MKFGVTIDKRPEKSKSGRVYKYKVWYRTSDGKLHSRGAVEDVGLNDIIKCFGESEAEVKLDETATETRRERFLEEI